MSRTSGVVCLVLALSLGAAGGAALAEPLAKEECDILQAEHTVLVATGVREQLGRGAEWGKANLSPAQLKSVERFIVLEEQVSFRCGLAKLRASLPVGEEGGEQELDDKGNPVPAKAKLDQPADAQGKGKRKPVPKAVVPAKDQAAAAPVKPKARAATAKGEAQPSAAKSTPKAKAKADDAYRPPATKGPGGDPFAGNVPDQKK